MEARPQPEERRRGVERVRRGLRMRGTVQGVGFRPAVYRIACALGLAGLVRNDDGGVWIEVEGEPAPVERFLSVLRAELPPLARLDAVSSQALAPTFESGFTILPSERRGAAAHSRIPPDIAPCAECLRELTDPANRRFRYPFINCTACGPRYTLIEELPYDRERTTMRAFTLCAECRREYQDPRDRRFHAEPNACLTCGPRLRLDRPGLPALVGDEALVEAARLLGDGGVVAVRGVGGFLLACDARNARTVSALRRRKARPHKPFALMARDLDEIERVAVVDAAARRALLDPTRPIVLLPRRDETHGVIAAEVAPGLRELGVMLPSTPLHHLLLREGPELLVMTSGNHADEPLAIDDDEAELRLAGIADARLSHDRPIHARVDDSVVRIVAGEVQPVRRARGLAPEPIALEYATEPVLAVGGERKSTVCLTRPGEAFVSQHLGDITHPATLALFEETIAKLARLCDVESAHVAHDLHPDYASTRWALASGLPRIAVQHHHAHLVSCLAEHARRGPALGVAFDGTGCGPAGELWGGEFLHFDLRGYRRLGHLHGLALAGGEAAIRAPWRLALAALIDAGIDSDKLPARMVPRGRPGAEAVLRLLHQRELSPIATSAGRWFDAVSALCGVRDEVSYEGQAAIELEALASGDGDPYPFTIERDGPFEIDLRPTVRAIVEQRDPAGTVAARFHETLARVVLASCLRAREQTKLSLVALSGGCFQNRRLSERCHALLGAAGFDVLLHRRVPPNDGGLSLGQAAIASYMLAFPTERSRHVPRHPR